jgi:hypothetical protein
VIAATTITINSPLRVIGAKPLVLIADDSTKTVYGSGPWTSGQQTESGTCSIAKCITQSR